MQDTQEPRFIDGPVPLILDMVRVIAATMVLAGHLAQLRIYRGPWPFDESFQHVAVIIFFVLSGLVIANSVAARRVAAMDYLIARVTRILPVALLAIAFGVAARAIVITFGFAAVLEPPRSISLDLPSITLPALFLSESWSGIGPTWNPPFWSLCYEVWYYALFGAATYFNGRARLVVLVLAGLVAGPRILLLMPVWCTGVWLAHSRRFNTLSAPVGAINIIFALLMIVSIDQLATPVYEAMFRMTGLGEPVLHFSQFFLTDWALALMVLALFIGLRPIAFRYAANFERMRSPVVALAGSSFTLYALHWPILSVLAGFDVHVDTVFGWLMMVAALQVGALALSRIAEAQRYRLRRSLARLLSPLPATNPKIT